MITELKEMVDKEVEIEFEIKAQEFIKKTKAKTQTVIIDTDNELLEDVTEKVLLVKDGRQLLM